MYKKVLFVLLTRETKHSRTVRGPRLFAYIWMDNGD